MLKEADAEVAAMVRRLHRLAQMRDADFANLVVRRDGRAEVEIFTYRGTHCGVERYDIDDAGNVVKLSTPMY